MRFIFLGLTAIWVSNLGSMIDAASSSKDIYDHIPVTEVRALTELNPAIKVLAHVKIYGLELVVLMRPDRSLFFMSHDGKKFVDHTDDPDSKIALSAFKSELAAGLIRPMDIADHFDFNADSHGVSLGVKRFDSLKSALVDPEAMALISPFMRMLAFKGTDGLAGAVVFHFFDPDRGDGSMAMLSPDEPSRLLVLERDENMKFKEVEVPDNAELSDHFNKELQRGSRGNIGVERLGHNRIIVKVGDMGYAVLSQDGGRFVAADKALTDPFLCPRIAVYRRMKCHTVPKVDSKLEGSLEKDYVPLAHYLRSDSDAQMIVTQKISDKSIFILYSDSENEGFLKSETQDADEKSFVEKVRRLIESQDLKPQSWKDHTVYEYNEKQSNFAIHDLSQKIATVVAKNSELPAVKLFVEFESNQEGY